MDCYQLIASFFGTYGALSDAEITEIYRRIEAIDLRSGDFLQRSVSHSSRLNYVVEGVVGIYAIFENGDSRLCHLVGSGQFFTDLVGYWGDVCQTYSFIALCKSEVLSLKATNARFLIQEIPELSALYVRAREQSLLNIIYCEDLMRRGRTEERYQRFVERYPKFIQKIPLKYIAEYLGVTPQSLSRIRKFF